MSLNVSAIKLRIQGVWSHQGFQKYFRNTGWMFFGKVISIILSFLVGAWLARYLGPKNYGILNYAFAFVGLFTFITQLGIAPILAREVIHTPEKRDLLLGTSFRLLSLSGISAFILVVVASFLFESSAVVRGLIILYATTFLSSGFTVISTFFDATVQSKINVKVSLFIAIIGSLLKVILILLQQGLIWLMLIFAVESILNTFLLVVNYKKRQSSFFFNVYNKEIAKSMLRGAWLLMLAGAASFLFTRVDQVMVRHFLGEVAVGLYASAIKLVEIWYFIPGLICSSLFPAIINAKKTDENKYKKRLKSLYILLVSIGVAIAIPLSFFAKWAIYVVFGNEYIAAVSILQIYVWSGIGLFFMWGIQQRYLSENRLHMIFYVYLISMSVNVVLNFILIPRFNLNGAAWATLISYSFIPIFSICIESVGKLFKKEI